MRRMNQKNKYSYWEHRQAQNMHEYMLEADKAADEISQLYQRASRYLSIKADDVFEKYQSKHGLSENEARRLLNELKDKTCLDELHAKLKNGSSDAKRKELLKQLEAPAYQARLERLRQLQNQIDLTMTKIYQQEKQKSTSFYTDLAHESYYKSIFNIQQQTGLGFSFSHIDPAMINRVINSKWSGNNYSGRIWNNTRALAQDIKEELLVNLVTGRTNREAAQIIQNKHAVGAGEARRLVRTESNYLASEINAKAYEEAEIEKYKFCSILDLKTSSVCRNLDGKIYLVSERKIGVNSPPMHPWCRSTTIGVVGDYEGLTRRARDPVTGKVLTIPADMNYQEWHDKYVKSRPEAELAEKQLKNRASDRKQWEKYKQTLGKEYVPENLNDFQKMKYTDKNEYEIVKAQAKGMSYYNNAVSREPDITAHVKSIAKNNGMDMAGLEYRVKEKDSYLRKIRSNYNPEGNVYEVKDILRYTYTSNPEQLVDKTLKSIEMHNDMGYNTSVVKNYWLDRKNAYNGINTIVKAPNGQKFELQYHTQESYAVKDTMHGLYEKWRMQDKGSLEAIELKKQMHQMSSAMEVPKNISEVK